MDDQPVGQAIPMKDIHARGLPGNVQPIGPCHQWKEPDRLPHDVQEHQAEWLVGLHGQPG